MLSIGKVGPGNAGYYESAVVAGLEDYYAGDGEVPGRWIGRADLVGAVAGSLATAVDSKLLLEARCAPDGSRLGKTVVTQRSVTAFDLTFSAPKSVSVLYALGDDEVVAAVEAAHTAAVEQAIASLSPRIAFTRTGHAGAAVVDADGVFGMRYRHRTSRGLDPQLHDHVLISNAVRTLSDGAWRTLDARGLYRNAKAAGVEYQSFLRAGLRASLGVEFAGVDENGQADIIGIDQSVIAEFSSRTADIEAAIAEWSAGFVQREGRAPSPVEVGKAHKTITLATRPTKPDQAGLATATLRTAWRARAAGLVDVDNMIASTVGRVSPAVIVSPSVAEVLDAVETRHGQWSPAQLIEQIAARTTGPDPATIADTIEHIHRTIMASVEVIDLCPAAESGDMVRASDGRPVVLAPSAVRYTTRAHLRREIELVQWATTPAMPRHRRLVPRPDTLVGLDVGQADAVATMVGSTRAVVTVVGPAGAGKTRMLAAAVDTWQHAGVAVFGVGPSAASAQQLATGAGVSADTLHKLVYEHHTKWVERREAPGSGWVLPAGSVVIIDEAGMVDTHLLHTYATLARRNHWRTVLVGDHHQLDPVDAGGVFTELIEHPTVATVELDSLHRFEHRWEADASLLLRRRDPAVIDVYEHHGRIHGHPDQHAAIGAVVDAAYNAITEGRDVLVMASTNHVVDHINTTMTNRLLATGRLNPDAIEIGGRRFHVGQPVVTRANDRRLTYGAGDAQWVRNGDRWVVHAGTLDELHVQHRETGEQRTLPAEYIEAGNISVDYASTIHRAQGATVDEAHLILSDHTDTTQLYVAATRGRAANHIHTHPPEHDNQHHGPDRAAQHWSPTLAVAEALQRQRAQTTALAQLRQLRNQATSRTLSHPPSPTNARRLATHRSARSDTGRSL